MDWSKDSPDQVFLLNSYKTPCLSTHHINIYENHMEYRFISSFLISTIHLRENLHFITIVAQYLSDLRFINTRERVLYAQYVVAILKVDARIAARQIPAYLIQNSVGL